MEIIIKKQDSSFDLSRAFSQNAQRQRNNPELYHFFLDNIQDRILRRNNETTDRDNQSKSKQQQGSFNINSSQNQSSGQSQTNLGSKIQIQIRQDTVSQQSLSLSSFIKSTNKNQQVADKLKNIIFQPNPDIQQNQQNQPEQSLQDLVSSFKATLQTFNQNFRHPEQESFQEQFKIYLGRKLIQNRVTNKKQLSTIKEQSSFLSSQVSQISDKSSQNYPSVILISNILQENKKQRNFDNQTQEISNIIIKKTSFFSSTASRQKSLFLKQKKLNSDNQKIQQQSEESLSYGDQQEIYLLVRQLSKYIDPKSLKYIQSQIKQINQKLWNKKLLKFIQKPNYQQNMLSQIHYHIYKKDDQMNNKQQYQNSFKLNNLMIIIYSKYLPKNKSIGYCQIVCNCVHSKYMLGEFKIALNICLENQLQIENLSKQCVSSEQQSFRFYYLSGLCHYQNGNQHQGSVMFEKTIKIQIYPQQIIKLYKINIFTKLQRYEEAIQLFNGVQNSNLEYVSWFFLYFYLAELSQRLNLNIEPEQSYQIFISQCKRTNKTNNIMYKRAKAKIQQLELNKTQIQQN